MKNKILKSITCVAVLSALISVLFLDMDSMIPALICCIDLAWLIPFVIVNREVFK